LDYDLTLLDEAPDGAHPIRVDPQQMTGDFEFLCPSHRITAIQP
jgi:hypothetical protein